MILQDVIKITETPRSLLLVRGREPEEIVANASVDLKPGPEPQFDCRVPMCLMADGVSQREEGRSQPVTCPRRKW